MDRKPRSFRKMSLPDLNEMPLPDVHHARVVPQALLAKYTTFQLGGPCRSLIECPTPQALKNAVGRLSQQQVPFILIGGGSNLVVSDEGLDAVVIRYACDTPGIVVQDHKLRVWACTQLDDLALFSIEEGLDGLVFASGIPGTVGGAVVGNAGAWGKQVGDILESAVLLDRQGIEKTVGPQYFDFSYRNSRLKETGEIVMEVTFTLTPGDPVDLAKHRAEVLRQRAEKHPNLSTHPCAGSFFRNIEPTSKAERRQAAGWFLEQAGGKNLRAGGARIFDKHANIIVKDERCRAQDVYDLHVQMIDAVKNKFGLLLQREVRFVGPFRGTAQANPRGFW